MSRRRQSGEIVAGFNAPALFTKEGSDYVLHEGAPQQGGQYYCIDDEGKGFVAFAEELVVDDVAMYIDTDDNRKERRPQSHPRLRKAGALVLTAAALGVGGATAGYIGGHCATVKTVDFVNPFFGDRETNCVLDAWGDYIDPITSILPGEK